MNDPDKALHRLFTAARRESDLPSGELPPGLATRVLARLREGSPPTLWESLALGALPIAAAVTLACVWLGSPNAEPSDDPAVIARVIFENQLPTEP